MLCSFLIVPNIFFRPLNEGNETKKTSSSWGLLTTPSRFGNSVRAGWHSTGDLDVICFTGNMNI